MIGKINHGSNFGGLIRYLLDERKQSEIIGGSVGGGNAAEITQAFNDAAGLNTRVKKTVRHLIIGFAEADGEVPNHIKTEVADALMEKMGYGQAQYLVVSHQRDDSANKSGDPRDMHNHEHIHIAANAVGLDGKWVNNSFERYRIQECLRELEKKYKLTIVKSSWERDSYTMSQARKEAIETEQRNPGYTESERISNLDYIQQSVDAAAKDNPTMPEFILRMKLAGVNVKPKITRNNVVQGLTYQLNETSVRGLDLSEASFPKLQLRGVSYVPSRDLRSIEELESIIPEKATPQLIKNHIPKLIEESTLDKAEDKEKETAKLDEQSTAKIPDTLDMPENRPKRRSR
jgi:Relaxase/Mobilisation nuclease domain